MSTEQTAFHSPLGDYPLIIIICSCLVLGGIAVYISIYPPVTDYSSPFDPVSNTAKCGEDTFYHPMTNKCETFRPLPPFVQDSSDMIAELERTIRDISIDVDGNIVVERDADGIPVVSCSPFENEQYIINEKCQMTLK